MHFLSTWVNTWVQRCGHGTLDKSTPARQQPSQGWDADRLNHSHTIDRFSNNETRIMINNFSLRGLILMKLKI